MYNINKIKVLTLAISILLYGLITEPTPEKFGLPELTLLTFLALSVSYQRLARNILLYQFNYDFSQVSTIVILLWPMIGMAWFLNDPSQAIRDMIASCFICLPFFMPTINREGIKRVATATCAAGVFFSIREFANFTLVDLASIGTKNMIFDQKYLLQDPIVLFSALFSIRMIISSANNKMMFQMFFFSALFLICFGSFFLQALRLNILLVSLYSIYASRSLLGVIPKTAYAVFLAAVVGYIVFNPDIISYFIRKFLAVGDNGKVAEALQVVGIMSDINYWFGTGYGGEFFSSTYSSNMNFTHSFFTYLILKAGVLGFLYALFFIGAVFYVGFRSIQTNNMILQISILSMMPALLTQPTYKSFGFGVIALLTFKSYLNGNRKNEDLGSHPHPK